MEEKFALQYHLGWTNQQCNEFFNAFFEEKRSLKNHWLQKKEIKDQAKERSAKIDDIVKFVTKYINSRKSQGKG
jgi:hypothetical protein